MRDSHPVAKYGPLAAFVFAIAAAVVFRPVVSSADEKPRPNFVIVFTDDQGYADVGVFGAKGFKTPNLDRMAAEGRMFTDFHVPAAVCSASRSALMSGCYPQRISIMGALGPGSKIGINQDEVLLPEVLKPLGYATAIYGKWHLGDAPQFLPTRNGFDEYFGLPYSNDMWPFHPTATHFPDLPLFENDKIINPKVTGKEQAQLTTWYTEHAVSFIENNKDRPFFLYVPHNMPHVPLFVSDKFKGKSEQGLYGDVIMEIDWSVGQILDALKTHGRRRSHVRRLHRRQRAVAFVRQSRGVGRPVAGRQRHHVGGRAARSVHHALARQDSRRHHVRRVLHDDGPAADDRRARRHDAAGRPQDRRPRHPPVDLRRAGREVAVRRVLLLLDLGTGRGAQRSVEVALPASVPKPEGRTGPRRHAGSLHSETNGLELYNLDDDIGEQHDVAAEHPEIVERLSALAEKARADLGDGHQKRKGAGVRPAGRVGE